MQARVDLKKGVAVSCPGDTLFTHARAKNDELKIALAQLQEALVRHKDKFTAAEWASIESLFGTIVPAQQAVETSMALMMLRSALGK
jgi:hypothetical protein